MYKIAKIVIAVIVCLVVGYFSSKITTVSEEIWYTNITKPSFNLPSWVFAPVSKILFVLMGIAAGLVWDRIKEQEEEVKSALAFFLIQLTLTAIWPYLFFGLKNPMLALIEIALLWLLIHETYHKFFAIHKIAGYLLVPYLVWIGFAIFLNASIWWLNRGF